MPVKLDLYEIASLADLFFVKEPGTQQDKFAVAMRYVSFRRELNIVDVLDHRT